MKKDTKFKKGHKTWNKGLKASDDPRIKKASDAAHNACIGHIPWNKGLNKKNSKWVQKQAKRKSLWWKTHDTIKTRQKIGKWSRKYWKENKVFGKDHPSWKGGSWISKRDGYKYVYAPDHPLAKRNSKGGGGYYLEHRLVMEKKLGRILTLNEEVHHKNGIKHDNRLSNLQLMVKHQHYGKVKCPYCNKNFCVK